VQFLPAPRLRQLFGAFVFLVGLRMLAFEGMDAVFAVTGPAAVALSAAIGLAGGVVCGALGVGGGAIFVPALVLLAGVAQHDAQGVSLCVIVGAAAVGARTHARHGSIDAAAARWIVPTAVPAGLAGAFTASLLDGRVLQVVFASVLVVVGIQMATSATRALRHPAVEVATAADGVAA
jgi:hypothetical protein